MRQLCYVLALGATRARILERIFGGPLIPVSEDRPRPCLIDGRLERVFWIDFSRVPARERARLATYLAEGRPETPAEMAQALAEQGCPLLAGGLASVAVLDPRPDGSDRPLTRAERSVILESAQAVVEAILEEAARQADQTARDDRRTEALAQARANRHGALEPW